MGDNRSCYVIETIIKDENGAPKHYLAIEYFKDSICEEDPDFKWVTLLRTYEGFDTGNCDNIQYYAKPEDISTYDSFWLALAHYLFSLSEYCSEEVWSK